MDSLLIFLPRRSCLLTARFQEETWATNANAFVAQEDDETLSYSVRIAGFDLLGASLCH